MEFTPQYGQYLGSFLVDIPITWNFILQQLQENVAPIIITPQQHLDLKSLLINMNTKIYA